MKKILISALLLISLFICINPAFADYSQADVNYLRSSLEGDEWLEEHYCIVNHTNGLFYRCFTWSSNQGKITYEYEYEDTEDYLHFENSVSGMKYRSYSITDLDTVYSSNTYDNITQMDTSLYTLDNCFYCSEDVYNYPAGTELLYSAGGEPSYTITWKDENGYQLLGVPTVNDGQANYIIDIDVSADSPFLDDYSFRVTGGERTNEYARSVDIVAGRLVGNIDYSTILIPGINELTFEVLENFSVIASSTWSFNFPTDQDRYINVPINYDVLQVNNMDSAMSADIAVIGIGNSVTLQVIEKTGAYNFPNDSYNLVVSEGQTEYIRVYAGGYVKFSYLGGDGSASIMLPGLYGDSLFYTGSNYTNPPTGGTTEPPTGDIPPGTPDDSWDWTTPPTIDDEAAFWTKMVQYFELVIYWITSPLRWLLSIFQIILSECISILQSVKELIAGFTNIVASVFNGLPSQWILLGTLSLTVGLLLKVVGR